MRRSVPVIIIVLAYSLALMPDAVRLPTLIGHFLEHKARTPQMDLMAFLELHYADTEHHENGDETHERLPFHHHHTSGDNCSSIALLTLAPTPVIGASHAPVEVLPILIDDATLAGHRPGLLQPPRC